MSLAAKKKKKVHKTIPLSISLDSILADELKDPEFKKGVLKSRKAREKSKTWKKYVGKS